MCAHMLDAGRQRAGRCPEADEVNQPRDQERRVHGAVLPVLQIPRLKAPILRVQVSGGTCRSQKVKP